MNFTHLLYIADDLESLGATESARAIRESVTNIQAMTDLQRLRLLSQLEDLVIEYHCIGLDKGELFKRAMSLIDPKLPQSLRDPL